MRDPKIEDLAQRFAQGYGTLELPEERDEAKRLFAEQIGQRRNEIASYEVLLRTGELIGEDMTIFLMQTPTIDPLSREKAIAQVAEAKKGVPWYRRAVAKTVGAANWWQEEVTTPTAAISIAIAAKALPGQQPIEARLEEARRRIAAEGAIDRKQDKLLDFIEAATEAYKDTDMVWGLKGALELIVDPLNLIGLGIPGKAMKALPALRPLLFPLHAIDSAPDVIVRKIIGAGASAVKATPGLKSLAKPHFTAQVTEVERRVAETVKGAFGPPKIADGLVSDTEELFTNLARFPEDANPYSLRNVMNHIAEEFADSPNGVALWEGFHNQLQSLVPAEATAFLANMVKEIELKAILKGGKKISGEVIEGTFRERRTKVFKGILENLALDEQHARGIAEGIDDKIYTLWDSLWLKKIEPMIVRPFALSHLAFSGFLPMNMVEDITAATVGMGGLGTRGMTDAEFGIITAGLADVPSNLLQAEKQHKLILDINPNLYSAPVKDGVIKDVVKKVFGWPITLSSKAGWAIRRSAWTNKYFKEFDRALRESSIDVAEVDALREVLHSEFPSGLSHLRDEIGAKVWAAVSTGNPQTIKDLRQTLTSDRILRKAQQDIIKNSPELPIDVRRVFQKALQKGPITSSNVDTLMGEARERLLDWHKFSSAAIRDRFADLASGLTKRPPKSAAESMGLLTMFQHTMDDLAQLPREINAHARERARSVSRTNRGEIYDEAFAVIDVDLGKARIQLEGALETARPVIERLLAQNAKTPAQQEAVRRSIDEMFSGYKDISTNLRETWTNYRARKTELFESTAREERGDWFWLELDTIGSDTWGAEYEFRAGASNRIREGWNALLDTLPRDIQGKDREFIRRGLDASVNDAVEEVNKLRGALEDTKAALARDPEALASKHQQRITGLSDAIAIAVRQRNELTTKLEGFTKIRPRNTTPEALQVFDRNITLATDALEEARNSGLHARIPEILNEIDALLKDRESAFEALIPALLKPEWEALKAESDLIARQLGTETTEVGGQSLRGQAGRTNVKMNRFKQRVEKGEAAGEVERVAGITKTNMTSTANAVLKKGGAPETIDAMIARVDDLAAAGDESAIAFNDSLETARTTFAEPDILAEITSAPTIHPKRPLTKARAEEILTRTLDEGGASINLAGEDMTAKAAAGDVGRFMVGAYPEQELRLPLPDATADTIREFANENLDLLRKRNHFIGSFVDGEELVLDVSVTVADRNSAMRLASLNNEDSIFDAVSSEILKTETIATPAMAGKQQVYEELYTRVVELSEVPTLAPRELATLREAITNDLIPTGDLESLVTGGFLNTPVRLRGGKWRTTLTDQGEDALRVRSPERDIDGLVDDLPPVIKELDTVIETQMETLTKVTDDSLRLWDNPPMRPDQESSVATLLDNMAGYLDQRPALKTELPKVGNIASKRTTTEYNRWFVDYDNRNTFDFVMQRFMPFWMYESRRWPRLATLAAKRPVLGKHMVLAGGDWDYGYSPVPGGFEFNPMKGTAAGSVRRSLARDFPELHSGYRGKLEQGFDWFARGAFYFNPLITTGMNIIQGEIGAIAPPPVSLILHSMSAAGVSLPPGLRDLAFDSRYMNFLIDQVIADKFNLNPTEVRNLAENGDDKSISQIYLAEKEAAARMIAINQSSIIRYRPDSKREFIEATNEAIERIVGIPQDVMEQAQRLGLTYFELTAVSGPQHRAIRDSVPNFDAWIGASISLRPIEEQKILRKINAFWSAIDISREENLTARTKLSNDWLSGKVAGPMALEELSNLNRERGAIFNAIHNTSEFRDVPIGLEDRLDYIKKYGKPSPITSPVDEALEQYYSIAAEDFTDKRTGDIDWGGFFDKRKAVLDGYDEPIRSIMDSELRRSETELERSLTVHSPLMREYFAIRSSVMDEVEQANPVAGEALTAYRRLMNFVQRTTDPLEKQQLTRQGREILTRNPQLSLAEAIIRQTRRRMRAENPDMEKVYQLFIARPGAVPTPTVPRRSRVRTSGFGTFPRFR